MCIVLCMWGRDGRRGGWCMCHVVHWLLKGLGVNPTVSEVDEKDEATVTKELSRMIGLHKGHLHDGWEQFSAGWRESWPPIFLMNWSETCEEDDDT
jgi:hypothetical protein